MNRSGGMTSALLLTKARSLFAPHLGGGATHLRSMAGPSLRKAWKHFLKTHLSVAAKALVDEARNVLQQGHVLH